MGSTTPWETTSYNDGTDSSLIRRYDIPQNALKAGPAVLAIRVFSPGGAAGVEGAMNANGVNLTHEWQAKEEFAFPALSDSAQVAYPQRPLVPAPERGTATELYNGMIHPVIPYALRGFLWYQGESNAGRAVQYKTELAMLIKQWRAEWGEGDIPFYYCQLANYKKKEPVPTESDWAECANR